MVADFDRGFWDKPVLLLMIKTVRTGVDLIMKPTSPDGTSASLGVAPSRSLSSLFSFFSPCVLSFSLSFLDWYLGGFFGETVQNDLYGSRFAVFRNGTLLSLERSRAKRKNGRNVWMCRLPLLGATFSQPPHHQVLSLLHKMRTKLYDPCCGRLLFSNSVTLLVEPSWGWRQRFIFVVPEEDALRRQARL